MKNVGIIDYGLGNAKSVFNMILRAGGIPHLVSNPAEINQMDILILPGVGSFDNAISKLENLNMIDSIRQFPEDKNKLLIGICLGFQLLFDSSEEGIKKGLSLVEGEVKQFRGERGSKLLNMGWRKIESKDAVFKSIHETQKFYFVHKYYGLPNDKNVSIARTHHGIDFCCAIRSINIIGFQFHPEKSHNYGLELFQNLLKLNES